MALRAVCAPAAANCAVDDARAFFELARALGVVLTAGDERFLAKHAPRPMASDEAYANPLDEAERRALVDEDDEGVIGDLLELVGEAIGLVVPWATGIAPILTPLAALGLALVMAGAVVVHVRRKEQFVPPLMLGILSLVVAVLRFAS